MKPDLLFSILMIILLTGVSCQDKNGDKNIIPGGIWNNTDGNPINAHSAGILFHEGKYYWFGEYRKGETRLVTGLSWESYRVDAGGVSCYSATNLTDW